MVALELFAERGVNGTTLQMIADRLGVSKAAVYYHFRTKDDIVMAVAQPVYDDIARLVRIAQALPDPATQREVVVSGLVDLAVQHRGLSAVVQSDPVMNAVMQSHKEFEEAMASLTDLLDGPSPDATSRVATSMILGGISSVTTDPRLREVADGDLRRILLDCAQHLLRTSIPS